MASPSVNVNPAARDIRISFADSCNCCWSCCPIAKPSDKTRVYINHDHEVERFDQKKGHNGDETVKSYTRLEAFLRTEVAYLLTQKRGDYHYDQYMTTAIDRVVKEVGEVAEIEFSKPSIPLTFGNVRRINALLKRIIERNIQRYEEDKVFDEDMSRAREDFV